jgi:hypothetical protein
MAPHGARPFSRLVAVCLERLRAQLATDATYNSYVSKK